MIPYFGYARQDRKDQPRVPIGAKLMADLITGAGANRVLTIDLHAPQIQGFFNIPLDHLYSAPVLLNHFKDYPRENMVVLAPDAGSIKMARAFAKRLEVGLAIIDKRRPRPNEAVVMNFIGDVEGKDVIIFDDMIDTAGTLTDAARVCIEQENALSVTACCTHPILSGEALDRVNSSPIKEVVVSNTIPFDRFQVGNLSMGAVGLALGAGKSVDEAVEEIGQVVEGVKTSAEIWRLAGRLGIDMPIAEQVYGIIHEGRDPVQCVRELLAREPKQENV